jgi:hypothetical protein
MQFGWKEQEPFRRTAVERLLRGTITLPYGSRVFHAGAFFVGTEFDSKSARWPARLRNRPSIAALAIAGNEHWRSKWKERLLD